MNVYDEFKWRELVYDSSEGLMEILVTKKITGYTGFDPSAASLHVGSLLPIMNLVRLQKHGHTPIAILGGGTGMIGDPSGKTIERQLLTKEKIESNIQGIREQLSRFLDFNTTANPAQLINNADWLLSVNMLDFLRDIGKYFTVNYMVAKESVKRRLEQEDGITFTEFSYMLLQAYDFLVLFDRNKCTLQMGGSDQWGNILAGMELIRRLRSKKAYGLVFPLVTTTTGVKFGKTEAGAVWLDANLTSPFRFYQFWFNTEDRDVTKYLKYFTLLEQEQIQELESTLSTAPEKREAQKKLAREVTTTVHGETALQKAILASQMLFGGEITGLTAKEVADIFSDVPSSEISKTQLEGEGISIIDLTIACGLAKSKGESRRLIEGGGINVNNRRISDPKAMVNLSTTVEGKFLILRKGAKKYHLVRIGE